MGRVIRLLMRFSASAPVKAHQQLAQQAGERPDQRSAEGTQEIRVGQDLDVVFQPFEAVCGFDECFVGEAVQKCGPQGVDQQAEHHQHGGADKQPPRKVAILLG